MRNIVKRSVLLRGHKTSVSLEEPFWTALKEIAREQGISVSALVLRIDNARDVGNLSSALRLFVLNHYRSQTVIQPQPQFQPISGDFGHEKRVADVPFALLR